MRMNIVLDKMKELEEEAHVQASRYLQWKQTHILEDMQWEQAEMMAKMEEAVTTKMKLMEDMMSEEMRMIKDVLIDHKTTAHASGSSRKRRGYGRRSLAVDLCNARAAVFSRGYMMLLPTMGS
jgi:hypothetical protein